MNAQLLQQCAGCNVYVHASKRFCKECSEFPDITLRMTEIGYTQRRGGDRRVCAILVSHDRRSGMDRRGMTSAEWLEAVNRFHDREVRFK